MNFNELNGTRTLIRLHGPVYTAFETARFTSLELLFNLRQRRAASVQRRRVLPHTRFSLYRNYLERKRYVDSFTMFAMELRKVLVSPLSGEFAYRGYFPSVTREANRFHRRIGKSPFPLSNLSKRVPRKKSPFTLPAYYTRITYEPSTLTNPALVSRVAEAAKK